MNAQRIGEPINPSDDVKQTDQIATNPGLNSAPFGDKLPVDPAPTHATPMPERAAGVAPTDETVTHETPVEANGGSPAPLLKSEESEYLRTRWNEIQGNFVDEPRAAVQQADDLVSEVVKDIIKMFASERSSLEGQWNQGKDVSTEDLRKVLQHYRSFFNRLVA